MQRKFTLLMIAIAALVSVSQAFAQSSHDAVGGSDPDYIDDGGGDFAVKSANGKYSLGFRGHLQQNNQVSYRPGNPGQADVDIELKRARLTLFGNAFDSSISYLLQFGLERPQRNEPGTNNYKAPGSDILRDYYVNFAPAHRYFQIRLGKFRSPFSRQQLMSTSQMQFFDQQRANDYFQITDAGRDVGVMLHNAWNHQIEWAVAAISNGLVGRLGYNHGGIDGYDMVDWTGGKLRFGVAANGFLHTDFKSANLSDARLGADFIVKVAHASTNGALYYQAKKVGDAKAVHNFGGGIDGGYLIHKKFEPVLRWSFTKLQGKNLDHEVLGGLNYYLRGHHLKLQGYAGANLDGAKFGRFLGGLQVQFAI